MASRYLLQIVEKSTGHVVHRMEPGRAAEIEFDENLAKSVRASCSGLRGTGWTAASIEKAVRDAIHELCMGLKRAV